MLKPHLLKTKSDPDEPGRVFGAVSYSRSARRQKKAAKREFVRARAKERKAEAFSQATARKAVKDALEASDTLVSTKEP